MDLVLCSLKHMGENALAFNSSTVNILDVCYIQVVKLCIIPAEFGFLSGSTCYGGRRI